MMTYEFDEDIPVEGGTTDLDRELEDMKRRAIIPEGETFESMMDRYEEETAGKGWDPLPEDDSF